jgi:hypothetical protein
MYNSQQQSFKFTNVLENKLKNEQLQIENSERKRSLKELSFKVIDDNLFQNFLAKFNTKKNKYLENNNGFSIIKEGNDNDGINLSFKLIQDLSGNNTNEVFKIKITSEVNFNTSGNNPTSAQFNNKLSVRKN